MATTPSASPRRDLKDLANTRRITFATKLGKSEVAENNHGRDVSTTAQTRAVVPHFDKFRTHVKVFMISTGDDPGDECELQGYIRFNPCASPATSREIDVEMPVKKSWATENGGLGRFLSEFTHESTGVPTNFRVLLAEDDLFDGDDIIINSGVDWTPQNLDKADGRAWRYHSWNLGDTRFRATVWYQVTRL